MVYGLKFEIKINKWRIWMLNKMKIVFNLYEDMKNERE